MDCGSFGNYNKGNVIYYIKRENMRSGFCAEYKFLLRDLYYADQAGLVPVVRFSDDFLYAEEKPFHGTTNPFEYYFKQPTEITVEQTEHSTKVLYSNRMCNEYAEKLNSSSNGYYLSETFIREMALVADKYVIMQDEVQKQIKENIASMLNNKKTLGIHARGGDFQVRYKDHPKMIAGEQYFSYIDDAIRDFGFEQIFLATDDTKILNCFQEKYGDKMVYYQDTFRTSSAKGVHFSIDRRKNHKYLLGFEVLRDMHTLASCSGLIAGLSQVSLCTRITKQSRNEEFEYLKFFDNQVNYEGSVC